MHNFLKSSNEKDYLLAIKSVKQFVRVPKITKHNKQIKEEIIRQTKEMLESEERKLSDFIDFSKIMLQKFDKASVDGNSLILKKEKKEIKLTIDREKQLIKEILDKYTKDLKKQEINLSELKNLVVIDLKKQQKIKDYIDNLIFALYLNIDIDKLGLNQAKEIEEKCSKNPYYKLVNQK